MRYRTHALARRVAIAGVVTLGLSLAGPVGMAHAKVGDGILAGIMRLPDGLAVTDAWGCVEMLRSTVGDVDPSPPTFAFMTNDRGEFEVLVDIDDEMTDEALLNGGVLNLQLSGFTSKTIEEERTPEEIAAGAVATATTVFYDGAMALAAELVTGDVDAGASAALELPNDVVLILTDTTTAPVTPPGSAPVGGEISDACGGGSSGEDDPPYDRCEGRWEPWEVTAGPRREATVIGELHTYQDMWGHFTYSVSANTDIGVAYQYDNKGWRVSGSVHMGNRADVSNSGVPVGSMFGHEIEGNFNYVQEKSERWCWGRVVATRQRIRPLVWNGDVFPGSDTSGGDGYYTYKDARDAGGARIGQFMPGQRFARNTSKTKTYTAGGGPFGVYVSSQTGYNTTHKLGYSFGYNVYWHYLIGNDGPPSQAGVIYAY